MEFIMESFIGYVIKYFYSYSFTLFLKTKSNFYCDIQMGSE